MHFGLLRLLFAGRFNFEIDSSGLIENKTERMIFMSKIAVVYWSGTGNTEAMANAVLEGAKNAGADAVLYTASGFSLEDFNHADAVAFGCPSMGAEELEESEFQPMFSSVEGELRDKKIALFGSYGWGDGEWMRNWESVCHEAGANLICDFVIANEAPDDEAVEACKACLLYTSDAADE